MKVFIVSFVFAIVDFGLLMVYLLQVERLLNAGIVVPGALVAEAVRSHDPAAIADLRTATGYRAGVLHL